MQLKIIKVTFSFPEFVKTQKNEFVPLFSCDQSGHTNF